MRKSPISVGEQIGQRRVIKFVGLTKSGKSARWLVRCDCGREDEIDSSGVRRTKKCQTCVGKSKQTYTLKIGDVVGSCTVLSDAGREKSGKKLWRVRCVCGFESTVRTTTIKTRAACVNCTYKQRGLKQAKANLATDPGSQGRNRLLTSYKRAAKNRNINWSLSDTDFDRLTKENCYYCGEVPLQKSIAVMNKYCVESVEHGTYIYNGIDRIDSMLGYSAANCVPCCGDCNKLKMARTKKDFLSKILKVVEYQKQQGRL